MNKAFILTDEQAARLERAVREINEALHLHGSKRHWNRNKQFPNQQTIKDSLARSQTGSLSQV